MVLSIEDIEKEIIASDEAVKRLLIGAEVQKIVSKAFKEELERVKK